MKVCLPENVLFFCRYAKKFAEMHGNTGRQYNEINQLALAWQMQLYKAGSQ